MLIKMDIDQKNLIEDIFLGYIEDYDMIKYNYTEEESNILNHKDRIFYEYNDNRNFNYISLSLYYHESNRELIKNIFDSFYKKINYYGLGFNKIIDDSISNIVGIIDYSNLLVDNIIYYSRCIIYNGDDR